LHRGALLLDRDVLITTDGERPFTWQPGAIDTIRTATDTGTHVFVISRSAVVNEDELSRSMGDEIRAAGGTLDDPRFHRLSPGPSSDLIAKWEIDPARSILVSNAPDMTASAGLRFVRLEGRTLDAAVLPQLARLAISH
jgi:hypothetical protein